MRTARLFVLLLIMALGMVRIAPALAGFDDIFKGVKDAIGLGGELPETKIIEGLKQALQIGTKNAVNTVSRAEGYYKNPEIRIPLPDSVRKVEKILKAVGFGPQVDAFEKSMNHAAERAAPEARDLFLDTIKKMSFADARKILGGRDNEATLYFEEKTRDQLAEKFGPIINTALSQVGVTRRYQELDAKVRSIPFADALSFDLNQYVNEQALDGLFLMLAKEERNIRQDPAARVTDLLKEVFGGRQ